MKSGWPGQYKIQLLSKPAVTPDFHHVFNIYAVELPRIKGFLYIFFIDFPKN